MLPEMSEAVVRAIEFARSRAGRDAAGVVRPVDLLAGLLAEEEGRACTLLAMAGAELSLIREILVQPESERLHTPVEHLSPPSQRILDEAKLLARSVSAEGLLSSECLLLALLREEQLLCEQLVGHGLRFAEIEQAITAEVGTPLLLDQPLALAEVTERMDAARVLDAAGNRAREALRVLEDHARFCLDDAFLSRQLKEMRHDLRDALDLLSDEMLLQARETQRDVGTSISTGAERQRHGLRDIVQAGCKRLEEALRSLEEFGKLLSADLGARLEQLRYRTYTLERALLVGATARDQLARCAIQVLLTGSLCTAALDWTIAEAAAAGADMIQLREKKLNDRELLERARNVRRWTRKAGVLFIVNDRPDIARLVEADGVHLGQDDMPIKEARRIVGPDLLIGVSTHNIEQVRQAVLDGASYLGVGPTFPSTTKDFGEFAGLEFVRQAAAETSLPQLVIGGVNVETLPAAVEAGAKRVAVSAAVCQADDPRATVVALRAILQASGEA
jgi:thiamine-phosphate pyrophosphorylase